MAQGVVLTLKAVAVKGIGITILTVKAIARRKIMVFARRPGEFNIAIAAGEALDARRLAGGAAGRLRIVLGAFCQAAVGLHPKHAVDQRTAGEELAVPGITAVAVFLNGGIGTQRPGPFLADFFGNNVDHAAERIGAVKGGHRAAHHLDTFDGIHRDPVQVEVIVAEDGVAGVDAFPVDEDQGIAAAQTANADALAVISFVSELDPRDIAQYVFQVLDGLTL